MISFEQNAGTFNYRVAGIAVRDGAVLLHRDERADFWVLPGGRCEMGEDAAGTLRREMIEEVGAEPAIGPLAWIVENFFELNGFQCHELGLYFMMSFPEDSPIYRRGESFVVEEGDLRLVFQWISLTQLASIAVKPSFIGARIAALSDIVEHIVHVDRK
jgi:8-oxo-dGTP pyrophosphatase MutT (NUDIX family)